MIVPIFLLAVGMALVQGNDLMQENEDAILKRAWNPPELSVVANYWKVFSKLRRMALERCERRLSTYTGRRKLAAEIGLNLVKRSAASDQTDTRAAMEATQITEAELQKCVEGIIALKADDAFYRDYQVLNLDVTRINDQVRACVQAGGSFNVVKRQLDNIEMVEQVRSSPHMLRVYDETMRRKEASAVQKAECFASLNIPANFPFQLE